MRPGTFRWLALVCCASCRETFTPPVVQVPASLVATASPTPSATVGASAGLISVKVLDAANVAVSGVVVTFTISKGAGKLGTTSVRSGADGVASSTYRTGTVAGLNEITAYVAGVAGLTFTVTGTAGAPRAITFGQRALRYTVAVDSLVATATARDTFLNVAGTAITWVARDPSLIGVVPTGTAAAAVRVLRRPGATYLVAGSGAAADSLAVTVADSLSTPCSYQATPVTLAPGGAVQFDGGITCIRSTTVGAEYAVVVHLGTTAYAVSQSFEVFGDGIVAPTAAFPGPASSEGFVPAAATPSDRDIGFERRLRAQEGREIGPRVATARAALGGRSSFVAPGAASNILPTAPRVGDIVPLNVNAQDFCANPDVRTGRVVAITTTAIIVADVANPAGGFTDDEFRGFGIQLDTLVMPLATSAFGSPTDIDNNGRVTVFFTQAVNEMTPQGSPNGVILGYYYLRDLLPRASSFGDCPGSNVGEMFYLLVPDPFAAINGNTRTKAFVGGSVVATIAHEYQHLINASRRMYMTGALRVDEDTWLNEGLSHVAEELLFFRVSGLQSRTNIQGSQLALGSVARTAFDDYQRSNFGRYQQFLRFPESNSPIADDVVLATRGATWSFLRYLVDRARATDGDFWRRLVNSRWTGVVNLDSALAGAGLTTVGAMRDWSTAVLTDDNPSAAAAAHQQSSWNFISAFAGAGGALSFALTPRVMVNGLSTAVGIVGGGTSYFRFGVAQNKEALIRASAVLGGPLPGGIRLTIVRIR